MNAVPVTHDMIALLAGRARAARHAYHSARVLASTLNSGVSAS